MRLSITVPVELVNEDGDFSIVIENQAKNQASISLDQAGSDSLLRHGILVGWAREQFHAALLKRRRPTGLKDEGGRPIFEGDIVRLRGEVFAYPLVDAVVKWSADDAAFILEAMLEDNPEPFRSGLRIATRHTVIGNVFENPEYVTPARRQDD